jgi:hypothetical protein
MPFETNIGLIKGAKYIMETTYPEMSFVIENLVPAKGLILFAGSPKIGKSWFVLQLMLSICYQETHFIGHRILTDCNCLYLSLEDSEQRIQSRIKKQGFNPDNNKLMFAFKWRSNEQGVSDLNKFLIENTDVKLVCIDTKGKFSEGREDESFQSDYTWMSDLKQVADELQIAIILITHLRKKRPDDDPYEAISGSAANMAAADTTIMLKRARNQNKGILSLTSRDFPETEEDIYFDPTTCTWNSPKGISMESANMTSERQRILNAIVQLGGAGTPLQIANIVGGTSKNVSNMLTTMKSYGFVESGTGRGIWTIPFDDNYEAM